MNNQSTDGNKEGEFNIVKVLYLTAVLSIFVFTAAGIGIGLIGVCWGLIIGAVIAVICSALAHIIENQEKIMAGLKLREEDNQEIDHNN